MKRFKPLVDKLFWIISVPTLLLICAGTVISVFSPAALLVMIPVDLFVIYFLVSPLFGYVELRENSLYIKYGFILKKEIPYDQIRGVSRERKFYSDSMMSLKCSFEHINVKYNTFDVTCVSVVGNDFLISELKERTDGK